MSRHPSKATVEVQFSPNPHHDYFGKQYKLHDGSYLDINGVMHNGQIMLQDLFESMGMDLKGTEKVRITLKIL